VYDSRVEGSCSGARRWQETLQVCLEDTLPWGLGEKNAYPLYLLYLSLSAVPSLSGLLQLGHHLALGGARVGMSWPLEAALRRWTQGVRYPPCHSSADDALPNRPRARANLSESCSIGFARYDLALIREGEPKELVAPYDVSMTAVGGVRTRTGPA